MPEGLLGREWGHGHGSGGSSQRNDSGPLSPDSHPLEASWPRNEVCSQRASLQDSEVRATEGSLPLSLSEGVGRVLSQQTLSPGQGGRVSAGLGNSSHPGVEGRAARRLKAGAQH